MQRRDVGSWIKTILRSAVGSGNTYTYSVRDPWSDRERYMREAPMDLSSSDQNRLKPRRLQAERTNRTVATAGTGREISVREGFPISIISISYLMVQ
jgi:hypothetical protein